MDGTLVDTEPYWFAAERDLIDEFGHGDWPQEMAEGMVGFDLLDGAEYIRRHGGVDLPAEEIVDRLLDGVIARLHRKIPWRPGARELLAELNEAGVPCVLVTMSWRRFVAPVLAALPPGTFVASITGDEVPPGEGKPRPTPYLLGAEACGTDPRDCLAIEDSPTGVASAVGAGCRVLAVPNVTTPEAGPGITFIESLDGVRVRHLNRLFTEPPSAAEAAPRRLAGLTIDPRRLAVAGALVTTAILGLWWLANRNASSAEPLLPPGAVATDVWVPYWTLDDVANDGFDRLDIVREISPFWFGARGVDQIVVDDQASSGLTAEFLDGVNASRIVPSIVDEMPAGGMAAILADPETRSQHVDVLVEFARDLDVTGLDLDYEQFAFADGSDTWEATRPNWVAFVEELADALHDDDRTLTVSIPGIWNLTDDGVSGYWVYDHGAIAEHVDAIRIMAYDYSVAEPGPIAPPFWVADVVSAVSQVVAQEHHDKLVLGVPAYGVNWVESTLGECPASAEGRAAVTARSAGELALRRGGVPELDPATSEWSFVYALNVDDGTTSCVQNRVVRWVDGEGVAERVMIARQAGWGGVALWALGYDDPELWDAFVDAARRELMPPTTAPG
jgi:HAD superfamily hydrolase (TIGR01509 family)